MDIKFWIKIVVTIFSLLAAIFWFWASMISMPAVQVPWGGEMPQETDFCKYFKKTGKLNRLAATCSGIAASFAALHEIIQFKIIDKTIRFIINLINKGLVMDDITDEFKKDLVLHTSCAFGYFSQRPNEMNLLITYLVGNARLEATRRNIPELEMLTKLKENVYKFRSSVQAENIFSIVDTYFNKDPMVKTRIVIKPGNIHVSPEDYMCEEITTFLKTI